VLSQIGDLPLLRPAGAETVMIVSTNFVSFQVQNLTLSTPPSTDAVLTVRELVAGTRVASGRNATSAVVGAVYTFKYNVSAVEFQQVALCCVVSCRVAVCVCCAQCSTVRVVCELRSTYCFYFCLVSLSSRAVIIAIVMVVAASIVVPSLQSQKLLPGATMADRKSGDAFGTSVAMDGVTLAVGAPGDDSVRPDSGCIYIFMFNGSMWLQHQKIVLDVSKTEDRFGTVVALQGSMLVTAAPNADFRDGIAYMYRKPDGDPFLQYFHIDQVCVVWAWREHGVVWRRVVWASCGRRVGVVWASCGRRVGVVWASCGRRVGVVWCGAARVHFSHFLLGS
jgi:hypothetical protein